MTDQWHALLDLLTHYCFKHNIHDKLSRISDHKKVLECYKNEFIRTELTEWFIKALSKEVNKKSVKKSEELRNLGNEKFKQRDDETGLKLYTESIIHAPHGSSELSLALGNRSAVLFRLHQYENCVKDIDLAVKNFKNDILLYQKLVTRKGKALLKMKRVEDGLDCLNSVKELLLADKSIPATKKNKMIEELMIEFYCTDLETSSTDELETKIDTLPHPLKGENPEFPYASRALTLLCQNEGERQVVTNDDIEVGEILFVENPFSFAILPDYYESHCQNCCKLLTAPIACATCVDCLFCDEDCYNLAYNLFHKWECKGLKLLQSFGVGYLSFKTTMIAASNPDCKHYERVNSLKTHLSEVCIEDLVQYALTATASVIYLENFTNFFKLSSTWRTVEEIGFILMKHIIQTICNGFAIKKSNVDCTEDLTWSELSHITCATGIFPSASMMNHSCEPNIITSFFNKYLVVRASKTISKGEEVFNCYGPHFLKMKTEERQDILKKQFFFDCKCQHCILPEIENKYSSVYCPKCKHSFSLNKTRDPHFKCSACSHVIGTTYFEELLHKVELLREKGSIFKDQGNYKKAVRVFEKCIKLQHSFMSENSVEILYCSLDCAECYSGLEDYTNCWKSLKTCVPIIKVQCGEYSIEYADILKRTIDMFLLDVKNKNNPATDTDHINDILKYVDEMIKVIEYNFGSWSLEYSSLQSQKTELVISISCGAS